MGFFSLGAFLLRLAPQKPRFPLQFAFPTLISASIACAERPGPSLRKFFPLIFLISLLPPVRAPAQETGASGPYQIPQTVFVGDRGRLVVPLGAAFAGLEPFVAEGPEKFSGAGDLVIHRLELDRRGGVSRLLIDFVAFTPGRLSLPTLNLPPGAGEGALQISGLELNIASILSPALRVLAEPAPPLAVPGAALFIYGGLGLILLMIFLGAAAALGWRRRFAGLAEEFRRRFLLRSMERALKRLRAEARGEGGGNSGAALILARFSGEMRKFLTLFMGIDCRAWTSGEFFPLSPELSGIFHRSDTLRFSGAGIGLGELSGILDEAGAFLALLRASPGKGREAPLAAPAAGPEGGGSPREPTGGAV